MMEANEPTALTFPGAERQPHLILRPVQATPNRVIGAASRYKAEENRICLHLQAH